jgi:hypothetical protein
MAEFARTPPFSFRLWHECVLDEREAQDADVEGQRLVVVVDHKRNQAE